MEFLRTIDAERRDERIELGGKRPPIRLLHEAMSSLKWVSRKFIPHDDIVFQNCREVGGVSFSGHEGVKMKAKAIGNITGVVGIISTR